MNKIDVRFVLVDFKSSLKSKICKISSVWGGAIKSAKTHQNTDPNTFNSAVELEKVVLYLSYKINVV